MKRGLGGAVPRTRAVCGDARERRNVTEEGYIGQLVRAVRNTHHGFAELYTGPFAVLGTSSGVISDELPSILPFLAFAMLDDPNAAISQSW
ncbi:hypothetical protein [uncultured Rubinisphaera sp.]|uniref:hypothetical protein n=1 Tax=uncultured Rubinisphaera sp. TaxID=1678686 RepID=UPI0030D98D7C